MAETLDALHVVGVHSGYGDTHVLHGVELAVPHGKVVAVLGRNGMGKTTLMHTIMGLVPARAGQVWVDGTEVTGLSTHQVARHGIRIVPQGRRIFTSLTVEENLDVSAPRGRERSWTVERIYNLFPPLADRRGSRADRLSGGEQEMLAMARGLLGDPNILLLDEPSDGLAPRVVQSVGEVLRNLRDEGLSALLVEQNLHLAVAVSDEIYCLVRGHIAWRGTTDEFRRSPNVAAEFLGASADPSMSVGGSAAH